MTRQLRSNVSVEDGHRNFRLLVKEIGGASINWNEANTRFHIIDRFLIECLGWSKEPDRFKVEDYSDGTFRDYTLGSPGVVIWEAKRSGLYFDFPADLSKRSVQTIQGIFSVSKTAEKAMKQVQQYCSNSGVEFAVVCNGSQLIAFIAIRVGHSWLHGSALAIRDFEHLDAEFPLIWQCLSPDGIAEKRLFVLLSGGSLTSIPRKLSTQLLRFPSYRYKTELQTNLRTISELLLEDILSTEPLRPQFYRECYCDTNALSRDALISEQILKARYAALFPSAEEFPRLEPAAEADAELSLSKQIATEALARRPIVLLGDVGVGKTSFLEDLMYIRARQEFERSLTIYVNLGTKAALVTELSKYIISEIERQLYGDYGVDIFQDNFVRGVYNLEVKRFQSSFKAAFYKSNKTRLDEEFAARLSELVDDKPEHLRRSIEHIAKARKRQVVFMIDNADQRAVDIQQQAFVIAQDFAQNWNAIVFIAVRPATFFQSKRSGTFAAYPHKVFTILPPRPEMVIEKRLIFALKIAEGRIPADILPGVRLHVANMACFLRALLHSLERNRDLTEILANITGGNIRAIVEYVRSFIGCPNVEAEKIVHLYSKGERYVIPIHEFSKAAILGDFSHFNPQSSLAMNVFDVGSADRKEHFLPLLLIGFLISDSLVKDRDGFVGTPNLVEEMQKWGFLPDQVENALRRLTNKKLIETTERITFEEDLTGLIGEMPEGFRVTSIGAYHLQRWAGDFAYLDAMVFDTPIFEPAVHEQISGGNLASFDIADRYERTLAFRNYLSSCWDAAGIRPPYLDWREAVRHGTPTFEAVRRAIDRFKSPRPTKKVVRSDPIPFL
jgi:hypothetical protein